MYNNGPNTNFQRDINRNKPMNSILFYVLLFFILPSFVYLILVGIKNNESWANAYTNMIIYIIGFVIFILYLKDFLLEDMHEVKKTKLNLFYAIVVGYVILWFANFFSNVLMQLLGLTGDSSNQENIEELIQSGYIFPMIITSVICAPIVEELVFRKSIFKLFKNPYVALLISSLAFGMIHVISGGDVLYSIPYIIVGAAFGYIYIKNNTNIIPCILLHALSNGISVIGILVLANM